MLLSHVKKIFIDENSHVIERKRSQWPYYEMMNPREYCIRGQKSHHQYLLTSPPVLVWASTFVEDDEEDEGTLLAFKLTASDMLGVIFFWVIRR